jgi:hypothetical protein
MRVQGKIVTDLTPEDVANLVSNKVPESRRLDYKRALPGATSADKKEFLADASSFLNTDGGVLLFGISTLKDPTGRDTGLPD